MKTRIIHTKIWDDGWFLDLSRASQFVFLFLLTSESINICGAFEMPDRKIIYHTGVSASELEKVKSELSTKVLFYEGWVLIQNVDRYNNYAGPKNQSAREREMSYLPKKLIQYMEGIDTSIDTSIHTTHNTNTNHNHNQKEGGVGETKHAVEFAEWLKTFNETYQTRYSSTAPLANYSFWRKQYSKEDMVEAIAKIAHHDWLADKAKPELVLRTRDTHGNPVDRIGELLSIKTRRVL